MPDGVEALKKLGVTIGLQDFAPFRGIRFIDGSTSARALFPGPSGIGVRRTTLHFLLVERAAEAGVDMLWNTPVRNLDDVRARWIVGADGMNSQVRKQAGFGDSPGRSRRFGFRRHFHVEPWSDTVDVHWGRDCQIYLTPVGAGELCVAVISRHRQLRLDEALRNFPEIERRLRGLLPATPERGSVTERRRLRNVYRGNVALVGDASGSVDALTGEGLSLSFKQALALADAMAAGDLRSYNAAHRRIMRIPAFMARLMLLLDQRAWLRGPVLRMLASDSQIFPKLLAIHIGAMSPLEVGVPWFQYSRTS